MLNMFKSTIMLYLCVGQTQTSNSQPNPHDAEYMNITTPWKYEQVGIKAKKTYSLGKQIFASLTKKQLNHLEMFPPCPN